MAENGASGFMQGFESGLGPGKVLADAVAQRRASSRMNDVQDQIDAGTLDPSTAAGQKAIQIAIRNAQQPLSDRGLDPSYGAEQYDRLRQQGVMRANQQGGQQAINGDMSGGVQTSARGMLASGDIAGGTQQQGFSDQLNVGEHAINNDGSLDPEALAKGTARVAAMDGNPAAAMQWEGAQKNEHYTALSGMAGNLLLRAKDTPIEQLGGQIGAMTKLVGLGDVQYSPSQKAWIATNSDGAVTAKIDQPALEEFATHWSQNPENIPALVNAYRAKQADQSADLGKFAQQQQITAGYKVASEPFAQPVSAAMRAAAAMSMGAAQKAGWKIETGTKAENSDTPNISNYIVHAPHGEPLTMQVDVSSGTPVTRVFTAEGHELPPTALASMGAGADMAQHAAEQQAYIDAHNASLANRQAQFNDVTAWGDRVNSQLSPRPAAIDAATSKGGAMQRGHGSSLIDHATNASPYKSPYSKLNSAQFLQESGGNPAAVSPKGARGLAQLMPATARALEQHLGMQPGQTDHDPVANLTAGMMYRDHLIDSYRQQGMDPTHAVALGLAAYNAGPGRVNAFLQGKADLPDETKRYVASIMNNTAAGSGVQGSAPVAAAAPAQPAVQPAQISAGGVAFTNPFAAAQQRA